MKKVLTITILAVLATIPAMAQKVDILYAHEFDFENIATFQYVETQESQVKSTEIMHNRIVGMIKKALRDGGLAEVEEDPDIYVTYHFISEEKKGYTTTGYGYGGYWGGWYGWGGYPAISTSTTQEYTYEVGTLIIDAYDSVEKKIVWHGTGKIKVKDKPQKQTQQVENILKKLGGKWKNILEGKGK